MAGKRVLDVEEVASKIRDVGQVANVELKFQTVATYYSRRYKANVNTYSIDLVFGRPDSLQDAIASIDASLQAVVHIIKDGVHPDDYLGVTLSNNNFNKDAFIVPRPARRFDASLLAQRLVD